MRTPADYLRQAWERIDTPDKLVANSAWLAEDARGNRSVPSSPVACKFCLVGAHFSVDTSLDNAVWRVSKECLNKAISTVKSEQGRYFNVGRDVKPENHGWMKRIYDRAIALAESR